MKKTLYTILFIFISVLLKAQDSIPDVFTNVYYDKSCKLYHQYNKEKYYAESEMTTLTLSNLRGDPKAYEKGIKFDFKDPNLKGTLYYGLINFNDSKYPSPVWYGRTSNIKEGKSKINILKRLSGKYDMSNWQEKGHGTLGYRVANKKGHLLFEGVIAFNYEKITGFSIANSLLNGPFINLLKPTSVTISFETNYPIVAKIRIDGKVFSSNEKTTKHEILISDLKPDTNYTYQVDYIDAKQTYSFKTAYEEGSRKAFTFAYLSDSRGGQGGGERDLYGVNHFVMRKMMALANYNNVVFTQITGDLIDGYMGKSEINLQYANFKRTIEPFAHYFPVVTTVGNHEAVGRIFKGKKGRWVAFVPSFPFETKSAAAVFAENFVNPHTDLVSEDGAYYDPNPNKTDFPPYDETVFYYIYGNVVMVVLNSNYLYAPALRKNPSTGGNLHGYIMDNQLKWLEKTLANFEKNDNIDHVFVTQHTPAFPNGGHVKDDMWYNGDNSHRPVIAGKPVKKGIIERRDEYLNILINKSSKVVAMLTGDEHNYNKVKVTPEVNIYPENYTLPKLKRSRTIWQINNGAAGAPYYAQNPNTPWNDAVSGFSTQYALVLIHVDGKKIHVEVLNPETFELIDSYELR
jgi:hypothetical protein